MLELIELAQLPPLLQEAVNTRLKRSNQYSCAPCEIISMTKIEFDRAGAPGLKKKLYRVILLVTNTFVILEQTTDDGLDFGVSQDMLTIGTVKEIIDRAPVWTGLKE